MKLLWTFHALIVLSAGLCLMARAILSPHPAFEEFPFIFFGCALVLISVFMVGAGMAGWFLSSDRYDDGIEEEDEKEDD